MNNVQIFNNSEFGAIRTIAKDSEVWFVGKDVAEALGYSNTKDAIAIHVDEEDRTIIQRSENTTLEIPNRGLMIINESGLYSLVLSSKLPTAKRFKRWVTSEVLPSIRKHGAYATETTIDKIIDNPDFGIRLLENLKAEKEKNKALEDKVAQDRPKVVFADAVSASKSSILVGELAKLLRQNGINIGQNRLFEVLRNEGYLCRRRGSDWNMPTQRAMEQGLFEIKESTHLDGNGCSVTKRTPKVTGKGQTYFINRYLTKESDY